MVFYACLNTIKTFNAIKYCVYAYALHIFAEIHWHGNCTYSCDGREASKG